MATQNEVRTYARGDKVTPDPDAYGVPRETLGRVFTVAKVNPKNLRCTADDGGRGINFPAHILLPATDENVAKSSEPRPYVPEEFFCVGEIVTLKRPFGDWTTETPMVVTGGTSKVNVAPLGGAMDRYVRVPSAGLVRRDMAWLTERLMDEATS